MVNDARPPEAFQPDAEQLREIAARAGLGDLREARPLTGGIVNTVLLLRCAGGDAVLKINTRDKEVPKEAWALEHVRQAVVGKRWRTPTVITADTSRTLLSLDYLLMECLSGENASSIWSAQDEPTRRDLSRQLGEMAHTLHAIPVPGTRYGNPLWDKARGEMGAYDDVRDRTVTGIEAQLEAVTRTGAVDSETLTEIARWLRQHMDCVERRPGRSLIHYDLSPSNVLCEDRGGRLMLTALFDFEWCGVGPVAGEVSTLMSGPDKPAEAGIDPVAYLDAYADGSRLPMAFVQQAHYFRMLYHLSMVVVWDKHWRHWGDSSLKQRLRAVNALLHGEPTWWFKVAGYEWPF